MDHIVLPVTHSFNVTTFVIAAECMEMSGVSDVAEAAAKCVDRFTTTVS